MGVSVKFIALIDINGRLAQLVRVPARHAGGHRFKSRVAHHYIKKPANSRVFYFSFWFLDFFIIHYLLLIMDSGFQTISHSFTPSTILHE